MLRIIIYAMGQVFNNCHEMLDWGEIVAIADKSGDGESQFQEVPIIKPQQITNYEFDYIAIFSNIYFDEIKSQLMGYYFIPEKKIISWKALFPYDIYMDEKILESYKELIEEYRVEEVLDVGMPYFPKYFFESGRLIRHKSYFVMDGIGDNKCLIGRNLYRDVYRDIDLCKDKYDMAILWDDVENIDTNIKKLENKVRYILLHIPYCIEKRYIIKSIDAFLCNRFKYLRLATDYAVFWVIDLTPKIIQKDISIYVVTHKYYQVQCDDLYHPICVGKSYKNPKFLNETSGDNISYLNEKINECTALYWIWKNTNTEYVGLNHYRRYFYNNRIHNSSNYIDKENVYRLLKEYDMVLAYSVVRYKGTVLEGILENIDYNLCMEAIRIVKNAMSKHQPDYLDVFDNIMNGYVFHPCNMFVTKREILNSYCEWLFSFLIEAAENIDVSGYGFYDKRIMGFLAERMLTIWLLKQNLKIKELPYMAHFGLD